MAINLELKIKINSDKNYINRIYSNKGKFLDTLFQKDIYFNYSKGLLKLRIVNNNYELIKYNREEKKGADRWSEYSLLFLSGENVENYLMDLFKVETIVEKERGLYIYKNTRIHLDKVKDLGEFLELETVVKGISKDEAKKEFEEVVQFLGLDSDRQIKGSYRDLMIQKKATIN